MPKNKPAVDLIRAIVIKLHLHTIPLISAVKGIFDDAFLDQTRRKSTKFRIPKCWLNTKSDTLGVSCGVPQGIVLGQYCFYLI